LKRKNTAFVIGISAIATITISIAVLKNAPSRERPASRAISSLNDIFSFNTGYWTNWYRDDLPIALVKLYKMRIWLEKHNLFNTYPGDQYPLESQIHCDPATTKYRSADGACTDLVHPAAGAANVRFGRNVPLEATVPDEANVLSPDPRLISRELLTRTGPMKPVPFLNLWAAAWIQFMNHDWFSHGDNEPVDANPYLIPLASDDPLYQIMHSLVIPRTRKDPSRVAAENRDPPTYTNINTHWWDASQIYGSDQATQDRLRSHVDGKMLVRKNGLLPLAANGQEDTGFIRNWWVGLSLLHNLFVLEHNKIADHLKKNHPDWRDERLFQTSRLVNAAVLAKIHTVEWTPAILANSTLHEAMKANWYGLLNPTHEVSPLFKLPILKDPQLNGIVGGNLENFHVPYSLTEEFISIYRLHSLLPDTILMRESKSGRSIGRVALEDTRDEKARRVIDHFGGMANAMFSFGHQNPGALTLNNYPKALQNISIPLLGMMPESPRIVFDMGAVDIVRDRERGVPRYNEFRRLLHLQPIAQFSDLTPDPVMVEKLERIYGSGQGGVEKLDLLIGTLAETVRPTGFGLGETQFQLFILMASRRLQADRFFTSDYNASVYSQEGLDWVDDASLKKVILRNYPELGTALKNVQEKDIFSPWAQ